MPLLTFDDIQTSLTKTSPFVVFTCINVASDESSARCPNSNGLSLDKAREILARGKSLLSLKTLRDFVRCLLCEEDQPCCETVVSRWAKELGIALKGRRPKRSTTPSSGSSHQASSRPGSSAKSKGRLPSAREDSETPCSPRRHKSVEPPGLDEPPEDQTPEDNDPLRSVSASNRAYQRRIRKVSEDAASAEIPTEDPESTETLAGVPAPEVDDANSANESDNDSTASPAELVSKTELKDFTEDFRRGHGFMSTPNVVRQNVLDLFFRPIKPASPKKDAWGWVYAAAVQGYAQDIVKIGLTRDSVKGRLTGIQSPKGVIFDLTDFRCSTQFRGAQLERLEALVHAELSQQQLVLKTGNCKEYFLMDLDTAEKTIRDWAQRMKRLQICEGAAVDSRLRNMLWNRNSNASSQVDHGKPLQTDDAPICHEQRQRIWKEIFADDSGGVEANLCISSTGWAVIFVCAFCSAVVSAYMSWESITNFALSAYCFWSLLWSFVQDEGLSRPQAPRWKKEIWLCLTDRR